MANRFWVGGTGNWDAASTTHWSALSGGASGASVPGSGDSAIFDASSGGGTVTLTAAQTVINITSSLFNGTIDTNGQSVTLTSGWTSTSTTIRTITFGASTITAPQIAFSNSTNLTLNAGSSTLILDSSNISMSVGTPLTFGTVTVNVTSNGYNALTGPLTFGNLTLNGYAGKNSGFTINSNITVSGTLTIAGNSVLNRALISSSSYGTPKTITAATVVVSNADFQDITGAGAGSWNLSAITGKSGDCGGNSGITFTTPATQTATGTASFSWSTHGWTTRVPLPQDDVVVSNAFVAGRTITVDVPRMGKNIDFSGCSGSPTLKFNLDTSVFGSLTFSTGFTAVTGNFDIYLVGRSSYNFDPGISTITPGLWIFAIGGTYTLQRDLTSTNQILLQNGTFNANNKNITIQYFATILGATKALTMGSGTWTLTGSSFWSIQFATGTTLNANTSTIKATNTGGNITFTGAGLTYNNLWLDRGASTGNITIDGSNTFNEFKDTGTAAHSIKFTAGTTQHVTTFPVNGTAGNLISINSTTTGTHALIKDGGGTITCDYLNIQHSVATPSSTWNATNSTNNQAVATAGSGWNFSGGSTSSIKTVANVTQADLKKVVSMTNANIKKIAGVSNV